MPPTETSAIFFEFAAEYAIASNTLYVFGLRTAERNSNHGTMAVIRKDQRFWLVAQTWTPNSISNRWLELDIRLSRQFYATNFDGWQMELEDNGWVFQSAERVSPTLIRSLKTELGGFVDEQIDWAARSSYDKEVRIVQVCSEASGIVAVAFNRGVCYILQYN